MNIHLPAARPGRLRPCRFLFAMMIAALVSSSASHAQSEQGPSYIMYNAVVRDVTYTDQGNTPTAAYLYQNYYLQGTNINIRSASDNGHGFYASMSDYVTLDGGKATRTGMNGSAIYFYYLRHATGTTSISNYEIESSNGGSGLLATGTAVHLDSVTISVAQGTGTNAFGMSALSGSSFSNAGGGAVLVGIDGNGAVLRSASGSTIDLSGSAVKSLNNNDAKYGVLHVEGADAAVTLSHSTVEHEGSAALISGNATAADTVNRVVLDHVDLSRAANHDIRLDAAALGTTAVSVIGGTGLAGVVSTNGSAGGIELSLESTSWTVTADSQLTGLSLINGSSLTFMANGENDFMDITAASVMLQSGSMLKIDVGDIEPLIDHQFQLFKGDLDTYELNDARMVSADGRYEIDYEEGANGKGWFVIKGVRRLIPEPSTVCLGLFGAMLLGMRRMRA